MGFLKKLKKKISIKNIIKGVKGTTNVLPGGGLIKEGISQIESAVKFAKGESEKRYVIAPKNQSEVLASKNDDNQVLIFAGIAVVVFLFVTTRRRKQ